MLKPILLDLINANIFKYIVLYVNSVYTTLLYDILPALLHDPETDAPGPVVVFCYLPFQPIPRLPQTTLSFVPMFRH